MAIFFISATVMTLVLLVIIVIPLVRKPKKIKVDAAPQASLAVYRDQFKELENELAREAITQKEYDESRAELERRVLEDSAPTLVLPEKDSKIGVYTAFALVLIVPLFSAFLWISTQPLGNFRLDGGVHEGIMDYETGRQFGGQAQSSEMMDINQAIVKLTQHLSQNPGDLEGWMMLGRTMLVTQRYSDAVQAFEKANQLAPGNPTIMVDLADAMAMTQGQDLSGRPWELIQQALRIDSTNWKALAMAGTDKFNHKDYRQAIMYWERLLKVIPSGDGMVDGVKASIQEARQLGNIIGPVKDTLVFGARVEMPSMSMPSMIKEELQPLGQSPVPTRKEVNQNQLKKVTHTLSGVVQLSPSLVEKIQDRSVLYVSARPVSGNWAPIVQMRVVVLDFPVQFKLDNTMVPPMDMGSGSLDQHEEVIITARLGKQNSLMPQVGDLEGLTTKPVRLNSDSIQIVLDRVIAQ